VTSPNQRRALSIAYDLRVPPKQIAAALKLAESGRIDLRVMLTARAMFLRATLVKKETVTP
jgi:hypothetical protein